MIVDTSVYILSMIQVLIACLIRDFVIPLFVWKNYLKNKSYGYRFWFCLITQASLQINLVLLLGFLEVCNRWTIIGCNAAIYALILWNFSDKKFFRRCRRGIDMLWEAYKEDRLGKHVLRGIEARRQEFRRAFRRLPLWGHIRKDWIQVSLMAALIVYNIWFLTYNVMEYHCYQFSDIPAHQAFIYDLEHGVLFSDGIYPFGMHSMVYIIRIVFQLNLREILLYSGAYQTVILMVGLFYLSKQIFYAKYTPVATVLIISFMLNQGRYAASLPQEFGMYAVIGVAYFMIRYLHTPRNKFVLEKDSLLRRLFRANAYVNRKYLNSDAILLMLCVCLVINYHFYTAIAAICLVVGIGLAYIPKVFKKQYFIPLLFCGIMGAVIALLPIAACLAKGIPFQESMEWATSVITGDEWHGSEADYQAQLAEAQGRSQEEIAADPTIPTPGGENRRIHVDYSAMTAEQIIKFVYRAMYHFASIGMFGPSATNLMFLSMLVGFFCAVLLLLRRKTRVYGHDYLALIFSMIILCIIGSARYLGLIELVASSRITTFAEPLIGLIYLMPVDFAFRVLGSWKNRYYQALINSLSLAVCGLAAVVILQMGWYHAFFDVGQAYYNEAEYITRHIRQTYEKHTYTIVSPTEELYDILDYGYHTELSEFMNMVNGNQKKFTFPTKYVFFFIEKRVMQDYNYGPVDVSLEYAAKKLAYLADAQDYYFQRAIIESQAYYWAQKILQVYPRSFKVFYEDDIYVAYILEQNTYSPYDLQIDYLSDYADVIEANGWNTEENKK